MARTASKTVSSQNTGTANAPKKSKQTQKKTNSANEPNTENALFKRLNRKSAAKSRRAASKYKGMTVNGIIIHKAKEESNRIRRVQNDAAKQRDTLIKRLLERARKDKEKMEKRKKTFKTKALPAKQNAEFREEYERDQQKNINQEYEKYSDNRHMSR